MVTNRYISPETQWNSAAKSNLNVHTPGPKRPSIAGTPPAQSRAKKFASLNIASHA
jgi:hypothetical protein